MKLRGVVAAVCALAVLVLLIDWLAHPEPDRHAAPAAASVAPSEPALPIGLQPTELAARPLARAELAVATQPGTGALAPSVVRGQVLDRGHVVPGANVELRNIGGKNWRALLELGPIVSGADGRFELQLPADTIVTLQASQGLAQSRWVELCTTAGSEHEVVLTLVQPWRVRGSVVDADGVPARSVTLSIAGPIPEGGDFAMEVASTQSDEAGQFELHVDEPGRYRVRAWGPSRQSVLLSVNVSEQLPELALSVRLPRP